MTLKPHNIKILDAISETLYKMAHGERPSPVEISGTAEKNEIYQLVSYFNDFISIYNEFSDHMSLSDNPNKFVILSRFGVVN